LGNAIDDRYVEIERLHGPQGAILAAQSHTAAIAKIDEIVRTEQIASGFERLDGYLFLAPGQIEEFLRQEWEASRRAGLQDVELLRESPFRVPRLGPCLRFPRQGQFHPLEYLFGLAVALGKLGGHLFTNTHVERIDGGSPARVKTEAGPTVTCKAVV